ncbi:MAG: hypothetical protein KKC79_03660, partial [Gammaproteobacteria bacterium]|nr:hypothetical protein [Gammaproteobacteria bacterium]
LSVPATLHASPLNTADVDTFAGPMVPGAAAADAPIVRADGSQGWLLRELLPAVAASSPEPLAALSATSPATRFTALVFGDGPAAEQTLAAIRQADRPLHVVRVASIGAGEAAALRYDARDGTAYLLRPDQHVCARWRAPTAEALRKAFDHAMAKA